MAKSIKKTGKPTTRILIVDDHPIVQQGLSSLLSQEPDFEVCGATDDVPSAIKLIDKTKPHVVTIDISLASGSGLDLVRRIAKRDQSIRMLVCSLYDETLYAERALHAGALGYVNKHEATRTIVEAIRQVLDDKVYLSDRMTERLAHRLIGGRGKKEVRPAVEALSDRELEVFAMIGKGLTSAEIAGKLHLGIKTVDTYRCRIKQKLKLTNMAQLARDAAQWVLERG
jgi:DNA-binding NarL/FixJ family response regulator